MNLTEILGFVAGSLTTIAFLPQVVKTWKDRSAGDISLLMFLMFTLGVSLWLAYGVLINNPVIIIFNMLTLILAGSILFFKLKYK